MIAHDEYQEALKLFHHENFSAAILYLQRALKQRPRHQPSIVLLLKAFCNEKRYDEACEHLGLLEPAGHPEAEQLKIEILFSCRKYREAEELLWQRYRRTRQTLDLFQIHEVKIKRGETSEALALLHDIYRKDPKKEGVLAKIIINEHFNPALDQDQIRSLQQQWEQHFAYRQARRAETRRSVAKALRIGILSDGFHNHPVSRMTNAGLIGLPRNEFRLYAYSSSGESDQMTDELKSACVKWCQIATLSDRELDARIRQDRIDILIDMSGYHKGSRLQALSLQPAPIMVKWVGGLMNTMGLSFIDYLITDRFESPAGTDADYAEKLIRMPHGYICYTPPFYAPAVEPPPAARSSRITFGCFNNANKINPAVIKAWASILNNINDSTLLLKGSLYESADFQARILEDFARCNITADRILFEGQSDHRTLLATYGKVDITLDPWPFSGGLTTLESMLMGVPVVTYPGRSFASRHSASHVSNAGFPQLVAQSWQQYVDIATMLANDIDLLAQLRSEMRDIFLNSAVCDSKAFSRDLRLALLSVWHRHCDSKAPAALHFEQGLGALFEDEAVPRISDAPAAVSANTDFAFDIGKPAVVIDHGARLISDSTFAELYETGAVHVVCLDPARLADNLLLPLNRKRLQLVQDTVLGNGHPVDFHANLDNQTSGTLTAPPSSDNPRLASLGLPSIRLDDLGRDEAVDWVMLSGNYDNAAIIEAGQRTLENALLVSVQLRLADAPAGSLGLDQARAQLGPLGFDFHTLLAFDFDNLAAHPWMQATRRGSKLQSCMALFVRKDFASLDEQRLETLLFLLHAYFGANDLVQQIMAGSQPEKAERYVAHFQAEAVRDIKIPEQPSMSDNETALFEKYLERAKRYFEFGSGGSSKLAASFGLTVNGVESDRKWLTRLQQDLGSKGNIRYVDVGPTGEWGAPTDLSAADRFPDYSAAINTTGEGYDFILVDGRFRVACALETVANILAHQKENEAIVFIHDFWGRDYYQPVLKYLDNIESVESAAVFRVRQNIDRQELRDTIAAFSKDCR